MKYQRGFINGDDLLKAFIICLIAAAAVGALAVKGCDYILHNYTVQVKAK